MNYYLFAFLFLFPAHYSFAIEMTPEQEKWFYDDEIVSTDQINEGDLNFLLKPPDKPVLHSINTLTINRQSISSGWVLLQQCYKHLDPVPTTEIAYKYKRIRNLKITSKHNIETAVIQGQSIQLDNVMRQAQLCIKAEVNILNKNTNNTLSLENGPFHRKFLDGYYPYHVSLKINYPSTLLKLISIKPESQPGFNIEHSANMILIESYFEGVLTTKLVFQRR